MLENPVSRLLDRISSPWRLWLMVSATGFLVLTEADRLIGEIPSATQSVHTLNEVIGPFALISRSAWADWATIADGGGPGILIQLHTLADAFFWIGYGLLSWRLLAKLPATKRAPATKGLAVLIGAEAAEAIALIVTARLLLDSSSTFAMSWALAAISTVKWIACIAFFGRLVVGLLRVTTLRIAFLGTLRGVYEQRLALIVVGVLGVLAVFPAGSILEQVPDIERAWLYLDGDVPRVHLELVFTSGAVLVAVAISQFFFGRARARRTRGADRARAVNGRGIYIPWIGFATALLLIGLVLLATTTDVVDLGRLLVAVVVTFLLVAVSLGIRWLHRRDSPSSPLLGDRPRRMQTASYAEAKRAGDAFTSALIALAALGLVRSFASPVLIGAHDPSFVDDIMGLYAPSVAFFVIGVILSLVSVTVVNLAIRGFDRVAQDRLAARIADQRGLRSQGRRDAQPSSAQSGRATPSKPVNDHPRRSPIGRAGAAVAEAVYDSNGAPKDFVIWIGTAYFTLLSLATLWCFLLYPRGISAFFGTLGSITLLLGAFATVLSSTALFLARRNALEVFRFAGLRATPILSMLIVLPIIAAQFGDSVALHAVNNGSGMRLTDTRDTIGDRFDTWLLDNADCATSVTGSTIPVLPLVLIAAEGGGIRAANWTIDGYSALAADGECAQKSVFLSSGVSGGSVGIATVRVGSKEKFAASEDLSDDALAIGVAGLFVGDVLGALTGIRVPTIDARTPDGTTGPRTWHDRAEQIQNAWIKKIPAFGNPYGDAVRQPTGAIIFNSTDTLSRCKVIVSQLDLSTSTTFRAYDGDYDVAGCAGPSAEQAATIDLRDYYGSCPYSFDWATAAMLSARFPIVTPAGRVSASQFAKTCSIPHDLQLVDGGYIDNSGLGTISNLAPDLSRVILQHNQLVGSTGPYVMPIVVFLHNRPGDDIAVEANAPLPELFVPLTAIVNAPRLQTKPASWLTRIASNFDGICPVATHQHPSGCSAALDGLRRTFPDSAVVVAPSTGPSVGVPLGWSLSDMTRTHLHSEMANQSAYTLEDEIARRQQDGDNAADVRRSLSYGYFGDLLTLLKADDAQAKG
jgi:hypothetical protein